MRQYKFSQTHDKVKIYWLRLKELNEYLPYFPENAASSTVAKPQLIHADELKEWLDQNLPQAYIEIAKTNLFDILGNPIEDVIEYLQTIESQLPKEKTKSGAKKNVSFSSSAAASSSSSKKRRGNDNVGKSGKGKQCPHCSKLHPTPKGDYSDCFVLARNKKNQASGDNRDPSEYKKARYTKSYNESSYKMMEGFQDMIEKASKASSSKSREKSRERMMRAAEIIAGNSSDSSSSSSASSEDEKSRKKRSVKKFRRYKR